MHKYFIGALILMNGCEFSDEERFEIDSGKKDPCRCQNEEIYSKWTSQEEEVKKEENIKRALSFWTWVQQKKKNDRDSDE